MSVLGAGSSHSVPHRLRKFRGTRQTESLLSQTRRCLPCFEVVNCFAQSVCAQRVSAQATTDGSKLHPLCLGGVSARLVAHLWVCWTSPSYAQ